MRPTDVNCQEGTLRVLDMTARLAFWTSSSRSFTLERHSSSLCPTRQLGWIDIHHPCDGHIKAQIRVCLPEEYRQPEKMKEIVRFLLDCTGIAHDETYEAEFVSPTAVTRLVQSRDRNGYTDRL